MITRFKILAVIVILLGLYGCTSKDDIRAALIKEGYTEINLDVFRIRFMPLCKGGWEFEAKDKNHKHVTGQVCKQPFFDAKVHLD